MPETRFGSRARTAIAVTLQTPSKIRDLQKKLYLRAKQQPRLRFYALYDKVYRMDFLAHAYALCRANRGAPGVDGVTFEDIERGGGPKAMLEALEEELREKRYRPGPVRRVYIPKPDGSERPLGIPNIRDRVVQMSVKLVVEPIFEADFEDSSYGFRPRRSAHDALAAVQAGMENERMHWVIDADVSKCFDTIPHEKLMKAVALRICDGAILGLIKDFLSAAVVDERTGGGPHRPQAGTPQGGVISPLLANVYLHWVDRSFRLQVERGRLKGRWVRYADDGVLLCPRPPTRELAWLRSVMTHLGLTLHPEKTRVLDSRNDTFLFLGHRVLRPWAGRMYLEMGPKAKARFRDRIRGICRNTFLSLRELVARLNPVIRGVAAYFFRVRQRTRYLLDKWVAERVARWAGRKRSRRYPAWSLLRDDALTRVYGLTKLYTPRVRTASA